MSGTFLGLKPFGWAAMSAQFVVTIALLLLRDKFRIVFRIERRKREGK